MTKVHNKGGNKQRCKLCQIIQVISRKLLMQFGELLPNLVEVLVYKHEMVLWYYSILLATYFDILRVLFRVSGIYLN